MGYLKQFRHDYFISYAVVDDKKPAGVENGWVTNLVRSLDTLLSQEIGRDGRLDAFWDREDLQRNLPLEAKIREALQSTACFVLVLTKGYLESDWCRCELQWFREAAVRQQRSGSRIFVVDLGRVEEPQRRQMFDGHLTYPFFELTETGRPRVLGYPEPSPRQHQSYYDAVAVLAREMHLELLELQRLSAASGGQGASGGQFGSGGLAGAGGVKSQSAAPAASASGAAPVASGGLTVFLAETSDDLQTQRRQVQQYLEDNQYRVLRVSSPAETVALWRQQAEPLLQQSDGFVQLLGMFPGREFQDSAEGLVVQQAALAAEVAGQRAGRQRQAERPGSGSLHMLQWRSPALLPLLAEQPVLQQLAGGAGVIAGPLEEFKAEVKRTVIQPQPAPGSRPSVTTGEQAGVMPQVFINAGPEDLPQAEQLLQLLANLNCIPFTPLLEGTPEEIRRELDAGLLESDGLIYFYGQISTEWLRRQFRTLPTVLPRRKQQQPPRLQPAVAICCGDPPGKPRPGVAYPGMRTIDLLQGDAERQLREWVQSLQAGGVV